MKSLLFSILTLTSVAASAVMEVPFDQNDAKPSDQILWDNQEVRAKTVAANGRTYTLMYRATGTLQGQQVQTQVIAFCNEMNKDSVQACQNEQSQELAALYQQVMQQYAPDCSKIALLNQDNATTQKRIETFNQVYRMRSMETNLRDLMPVAVSLAFQTEKLAEYVGNRNTGTVNAPEDIRILRQITDDVNGQRVRPEMALPYLANQINRVKGTFNALMADSRCTQEQLKLCPFNKTNGQVLNPSSNMEQYNLYNSLRAQGQIEMKSCALAIQPTVTPDVPKVENPIVQPQPQEQNIPLNPTIQ